MKGILRTLSGGKVKCLMFKSSRNQMWRCFNCLFKDNGNACLVLDLSLTSFIVVTDNVPEHSCHICKIEDTIEFEECLDFLHEHKMSSEAHRHLVSISDLDPLEGTCIILYHESTLKVACVRCIQSILVTSKKADETTPFSSLLEASEFTTKITLEFLKETLHCHKVRVCRNIQILPHSFCSEHRAFSPRATSEPQHHFRKPFTIHIISE
nr:AlNc14C146G7390 [Albugo laibachii Nc14]|eukprot:CCA22167.1 AlNc14C146G7390 [Albugo laibachii Nc14]